MVQDRASGARKDFDVSPVSKTKIYIGYFLSTVLNSLMVNGTALALCLLYILKMGWYMSASDVIFVILDMILLVLFGSTLSSIVSYPLKTQGQLSAVGTIVSAGDAGQIQQYDAPSRLLAHPATSFVERLVRRSRVFQTRA